MATDLAIQFGGGAVYGAASVVSAQPLDTVKTVLQAGRNAGGGGLSGAAAVVRQLGPRGLYRGSLPLLVGGSLFRSAQFGVYEAALKALPARPTKRPVQWQVVVAGLLGGLGRGLVEAPFELVKVRQQMGVPWRVRELYEGSAVTMLRNMFLFCVFVVNLDVANHLDPGMNAFVKGAVCSNLAWLAVWPADVIKSRRQSGLYAGRTALSMVADLVKTRSLFAGVLPGLVRSTVANGTGLYCMTWFVSHARALQQQQQQQ